MGVNNAAISCGKKSQYGHPDALAIDAFNDIESKIKYSYEGTIVYGINSTGYTFTNQYEDEETDFAPAPKRG